MRTLFVVAALALIIPSVATPAAAANELVYDFTGKVEMKRNDGFRITCTDPRADLRLTIFTPLNNTIGAPAPVGPVTGVARLEIKSLLCKDVVSNYTATAISGGGWRLRDPVLGATGQVAREPAGTFVVSIGVKELPVQFGERPLPVAPPHPLVPGSVPEPRLAQSAFVLLSGSGVEGTTVGAPA